MGWALRLICVVIIIDIWRRIQIESRRNFNSVQLLERIPFQFPEISSFFLTHPNHFQKSAALNLWTTNRHGIDFSLMIFDSDTLSLLSLCLPSPTILDCSGCRTFSNEQLSHDQKTTRMPQDSFLIAVETEGKNLNNLSSIPSDLFRVFFWSGTSKVTVRWFF